MFLRRGKKREDKRDQLLYDPVWCLFVLMHAVTRPEQPGVSVGVM